MKVISMKEFKEANGSLDSYEFYLHLARTIGENAIIKNVDLGFLNNYLTDDRDILIEANDNNSIRIYITTGKESSNSCLLEADYGYLKISEMKYNREGNGFNQEGILIVRDYGVKDGKLVQDSYAIKLSELKNEKAKLTYFGDLSDLTKSNFTIDVHSDTLVGFSEEYKITDTLENSGVLAMFRKNHLKGMNNINGIIVDAPSEDLSHMTQRSHQI